MFIYLGCVRVCVWVSKVKDKFGCFSAGVIHVVSGHTVSCWYRTYQIGQAQWPAGSRNPLVSVSTVVRLHTCSTVTGFFKMWVLGIWIRSLCLCTKHVTYWHYILPGFLTPCLPSSHSIPLSRPPNKAESVAVDQHTMVMDIPSHRVSVTLSSVFSCKSE